ncbi:MAG: family 16 glycosylhydrolase [Lachnospiraceae bacterium]|nr:family 16 glycosylhydrolase [Lachnospiraceae bacterium]
MSIKEKKKYVCKLTGLKEGTTTVKARYKGKVYKCRVKVTKTPEDKKPSDDPTPSEEDSATTDITFGGKKYALSFSDEFDTLDMTKWGYCPEMKRQDLGGQWRNSCSSIQNGNYVITCATDEDGTPISGGIRSKSKHAQTYGLYHMRFKAEKADGLWYAFWLYTDKMEEGSVGNGATDGAELDIFELVPGAKEYAMSVHWDGYDEHLQTHCELIHVTDDFYDTYHEVWYLWDENGYRLYLDGTDEKHLLFNFSGDKWGDGTCAVPCDIVLSAEFGTWGGAINKGQLPVHYYVDYVRVYKEIP